MVDDETGEVVSAHPSHYEAVPGGLSEIRGRVEALQRRFNEENKVRRRACVFIVRAGAPQSGGTFERERLLPHNALHAAMPGPVPS